MPEQVYNPGFNVNDGSMSGSTPVNTQGLVNSINSSSESDRDSNWWTDTWNSIKDWFSGRKGWFSKEGYGLPKPSSNQNVKNAVMGAISGAPGAWLAQSVMKKNNLPNSYDYKEYVEKSDPISLERASGKDSHESVDFTDMKDLQDLFWNVYNQYNADTQARADEYNKLMDDYFKNYYVYQVQGLKKAGINPLLAFQSLSSPSIPDLTSGRVSTYNPGSILSSYASQLGQDKKLGSDFAKILVSLLSLFAMSGS